MTTHAAEAGSHKAGHLSSKEREEILDMVRSEILAYADVTFPPILDQLGIQAKPATRLDKAKKIGVFVAVAVVSGAAGGLTAHYLERRRQHRSELTTEETVSEMTSGTPSRRATHSPRIQASAN